jgi:hypothetical protein
VIRVLDSVMGSGKTTAVFKMMKDNPDKKYLYISIFLAEVGDGQTGEEGRIQKELPELRFKMPRNMGEGKVNSLKHLISLGCNVACTHVLLRMLDGGVVDLLISKGYTIIIDEAIDAIQVWNKLSVNDVRLLLNTNLILVDEDKRVSWNNKDHDLDDQRYADVRDLANSGFLFLHQDYALISEYPPRLLQEAKEVMVLSYLFEGSMMSAWLKANGVDYSYIPPDELGLREARVVKAEIRQNIELLSSKILHSSDFRETAFSATWWKNSNSSTKKKVKKAMENCVATCKARNGSVFWTAFKNVRECLEGRGFTRPSPDGLEPFLPYNIRAINSYRHHTLALYMVNVYKHPTELSYLANRGVKFEQDMHALSDMLQFLFRGCVREGKPMKVLIASKRMKRLMEQWLEEDL